MNYHRFKKNQFVRSLINQLRSIRGKISNAKSSITFLTRCRNAGIIPNFISKSTKNISNIFNKEVFYGIQQSIFRYKDVFHRKILKLAIKEKHELLKHLQKEREWVLRNLENFFTRDEMGEFLFYEEHLAKISVEKIKKIHKKKFEALREEQIKDLGIRYKGKWFVNKTDLVFPKNVEYVLSLGQKHALPITREDFPTLKVISEGEDFIQTLDNSEDQEIARNKLTSIIDNHLNKITLTNRDRFMLDNVKETKKFLARNKDTMILKADKGNTTVAMYRQDYEVRMNDIVGDCSKYELLNKDPTSKFQKQNNELVEKLFKEKVLSLNEKKRIKTYIATAPKLYGLPKIHKEDFPLRPICSFINSPSYELCKYVINILKKLTEASEFNVKNSLQFKDRIKGVHIEHNEKLISLDVVSLFPSIPINLALDIIEEKWHIIKEHTKIEKQLFLRILNFCINDNRYFQYKGSIYKQKNGLPMGSPASPVIADIVMEKLIESCIEKMDIKPKLVTKYVDDLFCIIQESEVDNMLTTFNSFHDDINFTIEKENNSKLPYLDTNIIREGNSLLIDWYQKPTASGRIINYHSKHSRNIIVNAANNFIERVLTISDRKYHRQNLAKIRGILLDNSFPNQLINKLLDKFKNRRTQNIVHDREPKIYKSMTYIPGLAERLSRSNIFNNRKYGMAFRSYNTLNKLFSRTKDRVVKWDMPNIVYKIPCKGNGTELCDKVYIGTTGNKLKTRIAGHKSDQKYRSINSRKTALSSHCFESNHNPHFENVSIMQAEKNYNRRFVLEMLEIINTPSTQRMNFKLDTQNLASSYRYLVKKHFRT